MWQFDLYNDMEWLTKQPKMVFYWMPPGVNSENYMIWKSL